MTKPTMPDHAIIKMLKFFAKTSAPRIVAEEREKQKKEDLQREKQV